MRFDDVAALLRARPLPLEVGYERFPDGVLHVACRTDMHRCTLRSHFYLGHDLPSLGMPPKEVERAFTDDFGVALLQHCYNEFTFLSRFLPSLYQAENRERVPLTMPW